uniref:Uncharacterized protein n=1 Tax=Meloidogyne incognita TaxID=6306 RepID=A0A914M9V0_MELIC
MTILMNEARYPVRRLANTVIFKYARIVVVHMAISTGLISIQMRMMDTRNVVFHLVVDKG